MPSEPNAQSEQTIHQKLTLRDLLGYLERTYGAYVIQESVGEYDVLTTNSDSELEVTGQESAATVVCSGRLVCVSVEDVTDSIKDNGWVQPDATARWLLGLEEGKP